MVSPFDERGLKQFRNDQTLHERKIIIHYKPKCISMLHHISKKNSSKYVD
jgi:hypothetical protein